MTECEGAEDEAAMHKLRDGRCAWKEASMAWEREGGKGLQSRASVIHSQTKDEANAMARRKAEGRPAKVNRGTLNGTEVAETGEKREERET